MKWRRFFETVTRFGRPKRKPTDSLMAVYEDAAILIARLYGFERISRAVMEERGMSQGRWAKARGLLLATHVITQTGEIDWSVAPDSKTADVLVSEWIDEQYRRRRNSRRYVVPPLGPLEP